MMVKLPLVKGTERVVANTLSSPVIATPFPSLKYSPLIPKASASDTATVIQHEEMKNTHQEITDVMQKSNITESTSSTTSEKPIVSSGEILSGIEELKKDSEEHSQKTQITRVVSFDTSNLEQISKTSQLLKDQKSFDSDFGSRPESELKDFESRPQSMSEAMLNEDSK